MKLQFFWTFLLAAGICSAGPAVLDNSGLIPKIVDDEQVKLEKLTENATASPDWVKSLIIVEANVATASTDGTLSGMVKTLDHLAEMGVNGIWITPVHEGRHYGNYGIHTLNRAMTGKEEMPERWKQLRRFVDEAHRRNIRVFFDVVTWGVNVKAPLYQEKPEWFSGPSIPGYNGWNWNWQNPELLEWFSSRLVEMILMTGADGFRCDSAPRYAGYETYRIARRRLLDLGRKIALISEHASERRGVFDFDQLAFCEPGKSRMNGDIFLEKNIIDVIRGGDDLGNVDTQMPGGRERFYSFPLSCHDCDAYLAKGDPVVFGYQALFSPFLPIWYIGEEWNNPYSQHKPPHWLHANIIDWKQLEPNRRFFETIKKMIAIRREFPAIFEYFPADHRESNIAAVQTDRADLLPAYVRFKDRIGILIVPNNKSETAKLRVTIPYDVIGSDSAQTVTVKNLFDGQIVAKGKPAELPEFSIELPGKTLGIFLVAPELP